MRSLLDTARLPRETGLHSVILHLTLTGGSFLATVWGKGPKGGCWMHRMVILDRESGYVWWAWLHMITGDGIRIGIIRGYEGTRGRVASNMHEIHPKTR